MRSVSNVYQQRNKHEKKKAYPDFILTKRPLRLLPVPRARRQGKGMERRTSGTELVTVALLQPCLRTRHLQAGVPEKYEKIRNGELEAKDVQTIFPERFRIVDHTRKSSMPKEWECARIYKQRRPKELYIILRNIWGRIIIQ